MTKSARTATDHTSVTLTDRSPDRPNVTVADATAAPVTTATGDPVTGRAHLTGHPQTATDRPPVTLTDPRNDAPRPGVTGPTGHPRSPGETPVTDQEIPRGDHVTDHRSPGHPDQHPPVTDRGHPRRGHPDPTAVEVNLVTRSPGHPDRPDRSDRDRPDNDGHRSKAGRSPWSVTPAGRGRVTDRPTGFWARLTAKIGAMNARDWAAEISVWALSIICTYLAATGQVDFAQDHGITDHRKFLVPAGLELLAIGFFAIGARNAYRGRSPYGLWAVGSAFGGFAIWTNLNHGGGGSYIFAAFSAGAMVLWYVKLSANYKIHLKDSDLNGVGWLWITGFRVALRSRFVQVRLRRVYCPTTSDAIQFAELWLAVFDDGKGKTDRDGKKVSKRLRKRTAWRTVQRAAGSPVASLPSFAEVETIDMQARPTPPPPPPPVVAPAEPVLVEAVPVDPTPVPAPPAPRKATRALPPSAPALPAGAATKSGDTRTAQLNAVMEHLPAGWESRDVTTSEVATALAAAHAAGKLHKGTAAKPIQLDLRRRINEARALKFSTGELTALLNSEAVPSR